MRFGKSPPCRDVARGEDERSRVKRGGRERGSSLHEDVAAQHRDKRVVEEFDVLV